MYKYLFKSLPLVLFGHIPEVGLLDAIVSLLKILLNCHTLSIVAVPFYIPTVPQVSDLAHSPSTFIIFCYCLTDNGYLVGVV